MKLRAWKSYGNRPQPCPASRTAPAHNHAQQVLRQPPTTMRMQGRAFLMLGPSQVCSLRVSRSTRVVRLASRHGPLQASVNWKMAVHAALSRKRERFGARDPSLRPHLKFCRRQRLELARSDRRRLDESVRMQALGIRALAEERRVAVVVGFAEREGRQDGELGQDRHTPARQHAWELTRDSHSTSMQVRHHFGRI